MNTQSKYYQTVIQTVRNLEATGRYAMLKDFIQHGNTTVYVHCIDVAITACDIADSYKLTVDYEAMIRGALLHDYFLYDWHIPHKEYGLHGFTHPYTAAKNAKEDYAVTSIEEDIIIHHMFPLTLLPPHSKEAWIVCWADKLCATRETVGTRLNYFIKAFQREG